MIDKDQKNREKLLTDLKDEVTALFERVLDYAQVACPTPEVYKALRSKVLRVGNDCIRNVEKKLRHYNIEFVPQYEDIIEVSKNTKK